MFLIKEGYVSDGHIIYNCFKWLTQKLIKLNKLKALN